MAEDKHMDNICEAVEMVTLTKECWRKIDFLTDIKNSYGDLKISEVIENLEYQANKCNDKFKSLIKENAKTYIIDDEESLHISKFECEYRATRRDELTELFILNGCSNVEWLFSEKTGFYQPVIVAKK